MAAKTQRYKRSGSIENFMKLVTNPNDGKTMLDPYTFFMTDLQYSLRNTYGFSRRISRSTSQAPDLISWVEYGTHDNWWLLLLANGLASGHQDIEVGMSFFCSII